MLNMFREASNFNQPLNNWDVSNVTNMSSMFSGASSFNQDLSDWCVENYTSEPAQFSYGSSLTDSNKPSWGNCGTPVIKISSGICSCPGASPGATEVINGVTYKVVDNSTIGSEIASGNVNLCTNSL